MTKFLSALWCAMPRPIRMHNIGPSRGAGEVLLLGRGNEKLELADVHLTLRSTYLLT